MTPTEIKALRLLKDKGRMRATQFAEAMGWPGRSSQGAARNGAGYLARLAKKGLVEIHLDDGNNQVRFENRNHGYYAQISTTGERALIEAGQPASRWSED
jgi:hypothetical protein